MVYTDSIESVYNKYSEFLIEANTNYFIPIFKLQWKS